MTKYFLTLVSIFILGLIGYAVKEVVSGHELNDYPEWSVLQVALPKGISDGEKARIISPADQDNRVVLLVRAKCSPKIVAILLNPRNGYKQLPDDVPAIDSDVLDKVRGIKGVPSDVFLKLKNFESLRCD
ncbi:hypothetical protein [Duganella sacchari]|uniref:hypothetical protein n=1 Tax=Duganella sacchari TaxID=551987 RepID=UPI001114CDBB|nr:hypothetical protein [Duganella sacchari]